MAWRLRPHYERAGRGAVPPDSGWLRRPLRSSGVRFLRIRRSFGPRGKYIQPGPLVPRLHMADSHMRTVVTIQAVFRGA
jgi:hypothetical protein